MLCWLQWRPRKANEFEINVQWPWLGNGPPPPPPAKIERRFLQILILFYIYIHIASNWYCKRVGLQVAWLQHLFFFRNICIYGPVEIYLGTQTTYLGWVVFGWWVGVIQTPPPLSVSLHQTICPLLRPALSSLHFVSVRGENDKIIKCDSATRDIFRIIYSLNAQWETLQIFKYLHK